MFVCSSESFHRRRRVRLLVRPHLFYIAPWHCPVLAPCLQYELYQFLLRCTDADVERMLMTLTMIPEEEIAAIVAEHNADPAKRVGQIRLAGAGAGRALHPCPFTASTSRPPAISPGTYAHPLSLPPMVVQPPS